jgi:hypothetical protein
MKEEPKIQLKTVIATLTRCCYLSSSEAKEALFEIIINNKNVPDEVRPAIVHKENETANAADKKDNKRKIEYTDVLSQARHYMLTLFIMMLVLDKDKRNEYFNLANKEWTTEEHQREAYRMILGKYGVDQIAYDAIAAYDECSEEPELINERELYKQLTDSKDLRCALSANFAVYFIIWVIMMRFQVLLRMDFKGKPLPDVCKNKICYVLFDAIASLSASESDEAYKRKIDYLQQEYTGQARRQIIQNACGSIELYKQAYFFIDELYKVNFLKECQEEDSFFSNNPHLYDDEELEQLRKENEQLAKQNKMLKNDFKEFFKNCSQHTDMDISLPSQTPIVPKAIENKEDQESQKTLFSLVAKGKEGVFRKMMDELSPYLVKTESEHYRYEDRCQFSFHQKRGTVTKVCGILARYTRADLFDCDYSSLATYISSHTNLKGSVKTIRKMLYQKKPDPLSSPR